MKKRGCENITLIQWIKPSSSQLKTFLSVVYQVYDMYLFFIQEVFHSIIFFVSAFLLFFYNSLTLLVDEGILCRCAYSQEIPFLQFDGRGDPQALISYMGHRSLLLQHLLYTVRRDDPCIKYMPLV